MTQNNPRPMLLLILDGFGLGDNPDVDAIQQASTPQLDKLFNQYPHCNLSAAGSHVGLPDEQMGNSEVGHLNMGAGRIVYQDYTRIGKAIDDGSFFTNQAFTTPIDRSIQNNRAIHIMGLLSPGGVHSHIDHLLAMLELAAKRGATKIYLHAFLDGRDTPPKSAEISLQRIESQCRELGVGQIASLIGRYYAMDRDQNWERVQQAYNLLTLGQADYHASNSLEGLAMAYQRGETDEFIKATRIHPDDQDALTVNDGDTVIFMNFRADRTRELTHAFLDKDFSGFPRKKCPALEAYVCLTKYHASFQTPIAFPPATLKNTLGEYLAGLELKQLRIAETEKYAHVTFFFNGGIDEPFQGEDRTLIPSPKVATYDLQPEMSAPELTQALIKAIKSNDYDAIICNYANADMVGHTGDLKATIKAIECLDHCIGQVIEVLRAHGGEAMITADHGNADRMFNDKTQQPHTAHTTNPVPFLYIGRSAQIKNSHPILADIAPTMLYLMGVTQPTEMTGSPIVTLD